MKKTLIKAIPILIIIICFVIILVINNSNWNNGICKKCGTLWHFVHAEKQTGCYYTCENNHNMMLIEMVPRSK